MRAFTIGLLVAAAAILNVGCPNNGGNGGNPSSQVLQFEEAAHELVNAERAAEGLAALISREDLRIVARAHSEDMLARDFFDHVNPDGDDPFERLANAGITFQTAGENLAFNQGFPNPPATAVEGWMNSPGHRANILREAFTHAGMGVAIGGDGRIFFTQVFTGGSKGEAPYYLEGYFPGPLLPAVP